MRHLFWLWLLAVPLAGFDSPAWAAETGSTAEAEGSANDLPPGFQPIKGKVVEGIDPVPLVVLAYGAVLVGLFVYLVLLARGQGQLAQQMSQLEREIREDRSPDS